MFWVLPTGFLAGSVVLLVFPVAASASFGGDFLPGIGFFDLFDLIPKLLAGVAKWLFPKALRLGGEELVPWLVAVPNPTVASCWGQVNELYGYMCALGGGLLTLTVVLAVVRYQISGILGVSHPAEALPRVLLVGGWLVVYRWVFEQLVALVNIITTGILRWPVVAEGVTASLQGLMDKPDGEWAAAVATL